MSQSDDAPATKRDLKALATKRELKALATKRDLKALASKRELKDLVTRREMQKEMQHMRDEILRHFDLTVETIRHDLTGANRDEMETIKDRVTRLERHTGLVAA
ncbi:MAG: hypothetical protein PHX87_06160 [Candidatus Peribacteraceae bacterium]|nr:hypothetical protein [Candidatus Peribacteraceae bacterium]MDD5742974.1 hypothetical protein [Candidatus Peribacteraceae bacterium]